ncbi:YeiH family protein [Cellulomonas sp. P22]|uniref:YeiH family protein n=1 Tax=Cellulomonas sp. P22 TaxID=3373189 RepID=UPI00379445A4
MNPLHVPTPDSPPPADRLEVAPTTGTASPARPSPARPSPVPGVVVALLVAGTCVLLTTWLPTFPVLLVTIAVGVLARAVRAVPTSLVPGLAWTSRYVLRAGVVLLGLQLSARDVLALGPAELGVLAVTVAATFSVTLWVGRRLRVGRALTLLVATGFSICGAAAVAAMSPVADADDDDVATAVALVTLYGSLAILLVPVLSGLMGLDDRTAGLWAGLSVHEVAQVVAAAGAISTVALAVAVVAKLARVVLLAPLVTGVGIARRRRQGRSAASTTTRPPIVPVFVVGFLVAVAVRTLGVVPDAAAPGIKAATTVALGAAMVALGTQVHVGGLVRSGGRAAALGGVATMVAMSVSLGGLLLVG